MYFYNFLYDYEIDTILCSNKKWTNEELLVILKDYKKNNKYSDTFYNDFLDYLVDNYDFKYLEIEASLDVYDMRSIDYSEADINFETPNCPMTNLKDVFKNCGATIDIDTLDFSEEK